MNKKQSPHDTTEKPNSGGYLLDLFSTTPTNDNLADKSSKYPRCYKNAPVIAIPSDGDKPGYLYQSCCNDWNCPRCGELRARYEYGRIVEGARKIQATTADLYMLTLTCKGDEDLEASEANFGANTAKFWDALRIKAKRENVTLAYCAITERQRRGHPHIHAITNYAPPDNFSIYDNYDLYCENVGSLNQIIPESMRFSPEKLHDENGNLAIDFRQLFSFWIAKQAVNSGLGVQARLAIVDAVEGASRYIAKYLFKVLQDEKFPKNWKRVRYSQSWPKLETDKATSAFVVMSRWDWYLVADDTAGFKTNSFEVYNKAKRFQCENVEYKPEQKDE